MKQRYLNNIIGAAGTALMLLLLSGCATQTTADVGGDDRMERALLASGFRARPAATSVQRRHMGEMTDDHFQLVRQNGSQYYVYASKRTNRLFVGDRWAYQAYQGYVRNNELRRQGVFVWEVEPADRANNRTVDIYEGYPPFGKF